jgi:hypothetical protein
MGRRGRMARKIAVENCVLCGEAQNIESGYVFHQCKRGPDMTGGANLPDFWNASMRKARTGEIKSKKKRGKGR